MQTQYPPYRKPDLLIRDFYDAISCQQGQSPNGELLARLFFPGAVILPPEKITGGRQKLFSPNEYIGWLRERGQVAAGQADGYHCAELFRKTEEFGRFIQVFSSYEGRAPGRHGKPGKRGVHAMILLFSDERWWIASLAWDLEGENQAIPCMYLP